jgi:hypothetical protein
MMQNTMKYSLNFYYDLIHGMMDIIQNNNRLRAICQMSETSKRQFQLPKRYTSTGQFSDMMNYCNVYALAYLERKQGDARDNNEPNSRQQLHPLQGSMVTIPRIGCASVAENSIATEKVVILRITPTPVETDSGHNKAIYHKHKSQPIRDV